MGCFNSMLKKLEILFESCQPAPHHRSHSSEIFVVSLFPNAPSRGEECFKEERVWPSVFCCLKEIEAVVKGCPDYVEFRPAALAERASEDHVVNGFLDVLLTQYAIKVIPDVIMPPFERIACVEPVKEEQPAEHFDFHSTSRFPQMIESMVRLPVPEAWCASPSLK